MTFIAVALMGLFVLPSVTIHAPVKPAHSVVVLQSPKEVSDTEVPLRGPIFKATVTSYNAVPEQTDTSPFVTASGIYSNPKVVAARSRDLAKKLPFGTIISIEHGKSFSKTCGYGIVKPQVGYRVIADTMNARKHNQVDILLDQKNKVRVGKKIINPSIVLGICHRMIIRVVGHVNIKHVPKTQAGLALIVKGNDIIAIR